MYLSFRYRSRASLWWPAPGEDAQVSPAIAAGKVIPLEVTSSSFTSSGSHGYHSVTIDLKQLLSYKKQQIPVFYLIPFPRWNGEILGGGSRWLGDVSPSDLAFQRAGEPYFGNWTKVIHVGELLRVLKPLTKAYSAAPSQKTRYAELVRTPTDKGAPVWHKKLANKPRVTSWQDFWIGIDTGGRPDQPPWIVVPRGPGGT